MTELIIALIICAALVALIAGLAKSSKLAAESKAERERWEAIKRELDEFEEQFCEPKPRKPQSLFDHQNGRAS